jgi:hypothetical protein
LGGAITKVDLLEDLLNLGLVCLPVQLRQLIQQILDIAPGVSIAKRTVGGLARWVVEEIVSEGLLEGPFRFFGGVRGLGGFEI